jgi:hypothetical protein
VAGIDRNQWPLSIGIGGRLGSEYAVISRSGLKNQTTLVSEGWAPYFYEAEQEYESVGPSCSAAFFQTGSGG